MPNYTLEEKTRIRAGLQCPECFDVQIKARSSLAFECQQCGARWHADHAQFKIKED